MVDAHSAPLSVTSPPNPVSPVGGPLGSLPVWGRVLRLLLVTVAGSLLVACGPSQADIRSDIEDICSELTVDLGELDAAPSFALLPDLAEEAAHEIGAAAFNVDDVSESASVVALADSLHALSDAYRAMERQITGRDYESLAQTRQDGEGALAAALAAADEIQATGCDGIASRSTYFAIGSDGASTAAAAIAPTGDYVVDAGAACERYAADVFPVLLKLNLQSMISSDVDATPDAGAYLEAVEDILVINRALRALVRELGNLAPPDEGRAAHEALISAYEAAIEGFQELSAGRGADQVISSAQRVDEAARRLGVDCTL